MGLPWVMKQIKLSSFWPLLPLNYVGKISYLFKVYVEVSWYQQEINHKRLQHPNERDNLVVAFDLFEDQGWKMKIVSQIKTISIFSKIMMEKYDRSITKTVLEIWLCCCMLTQATPATLDTLGLSPTRRWRNRKLLGWCNEVRTLRGSSGGVCGGGGGLSARFLLFMQCLPQQSVLLVQQKVECAQRSSGATRWTVSPRHRKLNITHKNVGFCLVLLCYANHTVTPNTSDQHLMSSRTQTVMN